MHDPHETWRRREPFQSDPGDEEWLRALNDRLAGIVLPERPSTIDPGELPLVFIVGAPRSGTTLLSQHLSRHLAVGYIDNVIARFWRRPSIGIKLSQLLLGPNGRERIAFHSTHGSTADPAGPHEFGYFWRHWLRLDDHATHHPDRSAAASLDAAGLRDALEREILATFAAPVVFKNVICGFHAAWLAQVHPRSLFVNVERDLAATCASVLAVRRERYGSYDAWWSLKPSTYAEIASAQDPAEQVVRQIVDCRREMRAALDDRRVHAISVDYDELCRTPASVLDRLRDALEPLGTTIQPALDPPGTFTRSRGVTLPSELQASLDRALAAATP